MLQESIIFSTGQREGLYDITAKVEELVKKSKIDRGIVTVYARGATAAVMIQEGWDQSVQNDVIAFLKRSIPAGVWDHDRQDGNADAHLKAGMVGPSETIPVIKGNPGFSTWQNVFFCEFDGPRSKREVVVTVVGE